MMMIQRMKMSWYAIYADVNLLTKVIKDSMFAKESLGRKIKNIMHSHVHMDELISMSST